MISWVKGKFSPISPVTHHYPKSKFGVFKRRHTNSKEKQVQKRSDVVQRLISHHSSEAMGRVISLRPREQVVWSNNSVKGPKLGQKRCKARRETFQSVICYEHD